jgi:hypothetical protein
MHPDDAETLYNGKYDRNPRKDGGVAFQYPDLFTLVFAPDACLEEVVLCEGCLATIDGISLFHDDNALIQLADKFGSPIRNKLDLIYPNAGLILSEFEEFDEYGRNASICEKRYFDRYIERFIKNQNHN